jgi:hypothetical protein
MGIGEVGKGRGLGDEEGKCGKGRGIGEGAMREGKRGHRKRG